MFPTFVPRLPQFPPCPSSILISYVLYEICPKAGTGLATSFSSTQSCAWHSVHFDTIFLPAAVERFGWMWRPYTWICSKFQARPTLPGRGRPPGLWANGTFSVAQHGQLQIVPSRRNFPTSHSPWNPSTERQVPLGSGRFLHEETLQQSSEGMRGVMRDCRGWTLLVQLSELNVKSLKDIRRKSHHGKRRSKPMACQMRQATLPFEN